MDFWRRERENKNWPRTVETFPPTGFTGTFEKELRDEEDPLFDRHWLELKRKLRCFAITRIIQRWSSAINKHFPIYEELSCTLLASSCLFAVAMNASILEQSKHHGSREAKAIEATRMDEINSLVNPIPHVRKKKYFLKGERGRLFSALASYVLARKGKRLGASSNVRTLDSLIFPISFAVSLLRFAYRGEKWRFNPLFLQYSRRLHHLLTIALFSPLFPPFFICEALLIRFSCVTFALLQYSQIGKNE